MQAALDHYMYTTFTSTLGSDSNLISTCLNSFDGINAVDKMCIMNTEICAILCMYS